MFENIKNNIINKFDKKLDEEFEKKTIILGEKITNLLDHESIQNNNFAPIRERLAYVLNDVNNELTENHEKLSIVQNKLMRIMDNHDLSGSDFESFRRELASVINYSQHNME